MDKSEAVIVVTTGSRKSVDNLDLQTRGKRIGVTQVEVARELEIAESAVSDWLAGKRPYLPEGKGRSEFTQAQDAIAARKAESVA